MKNTKQEIVKNIEEKVEKIDKEILTLVENDAYENNSFIRELNRMKDELRRQISQLRVSIQLDTL